MKAAGLFLALLVCSVHADMYFHNPRGSNNRLDEAKRERNNANRLFDSQNNNRGGYNVGSLYYYTGSVLSLEWTNQHSCADPNNHCEQIVQYMCEDLVRDGATTQTIPENPANCDNFDCNNDIEFGMHETYDYYLDCKLRQRNTGLFIADRNLRGNTARFTRQNENGNRRGYECPEERDYYPYWHPTPWRDIVIFTNDATRCPYYQAESQNVKSRFACVLPPGFLSPSIIRSNRPIIPNTQEACEAIVSETGNGTWTEFPPDPRLSTPECIEAVWSRDNHLGNTIGGYPISYNWTIPDIPHDHCVLRVRYNISTAEYDGWDSAVNSSIERVRWDGVLDGATNNGNAQRGREVVSELKDVYERFGFTQEDAAERGYVFRQNPVVKVFPDPPSGNNFGLQLAINTNQFGRTFQDRSHTFAIRERPGELDGVRIHNLNVRGKRGNIVQVYPGVEYDFVPNVLVMSVNEYIHLQWTGSNTNPNNNDGQGRAGTDRSNMILLRPPNYPEGDGSAGPAVGHWGNSYPASLDTPDNLTLLGLSREDRQNLATLVNLQLGGEMSELDDAGTYYDLGPRKVTTPGTYYFMCSRNNNFSNRSQKGKIIVQENPMAQKRIGWTGGTIELNGHTLSFSQGALLSATEFRMDQFDDSGSLRDMVDAQPPSDGEEVSSFVFITPDAQFPDLNTENAETATIVIPVEPGANSDITILRANSASRWEYVELDTRVENDMAQAETSSGGVFYARGRLNSGLIAGVVVAAFIVLVIAIAISGVVIYFLIRRDKWQKAKLNTQKFKQKVTRSFAKQV